MDQLSVFDKEDLKIFGVHNILGQFHHFLKEGFLIIFPGTKQKSFTGVIATMVFNPQIFHCQ